MDITKAILNIRPGARFAVSGNCYEGLEWYDDNELPPPTEDEVLVEAQRLQTEWENKQYQRERAAAYPTIQEQMDILYHQGYDGWKKIIDEVKNKYPKPE